MKPIGRRAWRKWAKSRRVKMNAHHRALYTGAKMRKKRDAIEREPLPVRPFLPRSLVGMSQSARKRAAHTAGIKHCNDVLMVSGALISRLENYAKLRAKYRIGQRLRPCPGCTSCLVCIACENGNCKRRHLKTQHCDGSGVLPAKRHRRCGWWLKTRTAKNGTERCGMPMTGGGWVDCQHCGGSGWLGEEQAR